MTHARTSVCFAALVSIAALMAATDFEQLPTFRAGEILPASVAKGDRHQVEDEVKNVGYLNHYGIESDFGHFEAIGTAQLIIRLREISALGELDELSNTKVFADAVLAGATQSAKVVASVAKHPVETIKGVPAGIGKLFGRTKRTVEAGYEAGKDLVTNDDEEDCEGEDCEGETCEGEDCGAEDAEDEDSGLDQAGVLADRLRRKVLWRQRGPPPLGAEAWCRSLQQQRGFDRSDRKGRQGGQRRALLRQVGPDSENSGGTHACQGQQSGVHDGRLRACAVQQEAAG